ncbi:MAG: toluene tolerance protein [Methylotenera sp.]|jgi:tRNA A-37 threonylcarbamoyl transferase component Bud32|uniref:toluene tolerance protein n=1 Tax=Methylotenera sp. TaxID=2051956 RepID=UPI0027249C89|nr:toluene tolerance protein [Methylotenera sp.]MDO9150110.1 toluene tolerance protein [Methylotenera sp.]
MIASLNKWIRPSLLLTHDTFDQMISGGEVLEQDERGYKVIKLNSGDILKIFRLRRRVSGASIYSNARKFARNAERLQALGINTVQIKQLYHFEHSTNTAVLYSPLVGFTLKKLLEGNLLNQEMAFALGGYVAKLHQLGIHFRSLHMGNIVITPEGEYGLIDISDMSIYAWPLFGNTRARNFKHLTRYPDDIIKLGESSWESFKEGYLSNAQLNEVSKSKLRNALNKAVSFRPLSDI